MPGGGPQVELTSEHARVRDALKRIVGRAQYAGARLSLSQAQAMDDNRGYEVQDLLLRLCPPTMKEQGLDLHIGAGRGFAAPAGSEMAVTKLHDLRLATSYPGLVEAYLAEHGVATRLIALDGAVETAIRLGVADVIADVVETGTTLRQAGLEVFGEPILKSEAVLIKRHGVENPPNGMHQLIRRLEGVLIARNYVMMDYDIRAEDVDAATSVAPGLESPTISPLHKQGWVAVRVMVQRAEAQRLMDQLWEVGARAILTTDIHACRI